MGNTRTPLIKVYDKKISALDRGMLMALTPTIIAVDTFVGSIAEHKPMMKELNKVGQEIKYRLNKGLPKKYWLIKGNK